MADADQESLFEVHPGPTWIVVRDTLAILAVNPAAQRMLGYDHDPLTRMTLANLCAADAIEAVRRTLTDRGSDAKSQAPVALRHRSGTTLQVQLRWQLITYQGQSGMLGSIRELNPRHEQTSHLQVAQRLLRLGLWSMDLSQQRLAWSSDVYAMYGTSEGEFAHTFDAYVALVHPRIGRTCSRATSTS